MKILPSAEINQKQIRAEVIANYVRQSGIKGVVCFSCGNASQALRATGIYVVDIAPQGTFTANRFVSPDEIAKMFPELLDATSGHLPIFLITRIASRLHNRLFNKLTLEGESQYLVNTGSGETVLCLHIAFPHIRFIPIHDEDGCEQMELAPLYDYVKRLKIK